MDKETWVPVADVQRRLEESLHDERRRIAMIIVGLRCPASLYNDEKTGWCEAMHQIEVALKRDDLQQSRSIDTTCTCGEKVCSKKEAPRDASWREP